MTASVGRLVLWIRRNIVYLVAVAAFIVSAWAMSDVAEVVVGRELALLFPAIIEGTILGVIGRSKRDRPFVVWAAAVTAVLVNGVHAYSQVVSDQERVLPGVPEWLALWVVVGLAASVPLWLMAAWHYAGDDMVVRKTAVTKTPKPPKGEAIWQPETSAQAVRLVPSPTKPTSTLDIDHVGRLIGELVDQGISNRDALYAKVAERLGVSWATGRRRVKAWEDATGLKALTRRTA